jgi:uncharacterized protein YbjT (DUF2867 family)
MIPSKKVLLIGASGLIGHHCLRLLLADNEYTHVEIWVRQPFEIKHPKLKCIVTDFNDITKIPSTDATHIFCCLGSTIKKAGSQSAFRKVDYEYVAELAKLAERSHAENFSVVSSIGANPNSGNFYLRVKGEMEVSLKACSIPSILILRPSMLLGKRQEFRFGELMGKAMMQSFGFLLVGKLRKYRGIQAETVARVIVKLAKKQSKGILILESDQINKWQEKEST